jgi:hypothetical protein
MRKGAVPYLVVMVIVGVVVLLATWVAIQTFMCGSVQAIDNIFLCNIGVISFKQGYTVVDPIQDVYKVSINRNSFTLYNGEVLSDAEKDAFVSMLISKGEIEAGSIEENIVKTRLQEKFNYFDPEYELINVGGDPKLREFPRNCKTDTFCGLEYENGAQRVLFNDLNYQGPSKTFSHTCEIIPVVPKGPSLLSSCPEAAFFVNATPVQYKMCGREECCVFKEVCEGKPDIECERYTNNFETLDYDGFGRGYHISPVEYSVDSVSSTTSGSIETFDVVLKAVDNVFAEPSTIELHSYTQSGVVKRECISPLRPVYFHDCSNGVCTKQISCDVIKTGVLCKNAVMTVPAVPGECDTTNNEKTTSMNQCVVFRLLLIHNGNNKDYIEKILSKASIKRKELDTSFVIDKKTTTQINSISDIQSYIEDNNIDVVVIGSGEGGENDGTCLSNDFWRNILTSIKKGTGVVLTQDVIDSSCDYGIPFEEHDHLSAEDVVGIENQGGDNVDFSVIKTSTIKSSSFNEFESLYNDLWGENLFTPLTGFTTQVSGGVLTDAEMIYHGDISNVDQNKQYYLATKEYGRGRVVVNQIGLDLTQQYIDDHAVEIDIFVTSILFASKKVGAVEEPKGGT